MQVRLEISLSHDQLRLSRGSREECLITFVMAWLDILILPLILILIPPLLYAVCCSCSRHVCFPIQHEPQPFPVLFWPRWAAMACTPHRTPEPEAWALSLAAVGHPPPRATQPWAPSPCRPTVDAMPWAPTAHSLHRRHSADAPRWDFTALLSALTCVRRTSPTSLSHCQIVPN